MKAVTQDQYGSADILRISDDVPTPVVGPKDVLIRVHAAGLNTADVHLMTGQPYLVRLAMGLRRPRNPVLGTDCAGVVEAVGSAVSHVQPGDAVFGEGDRGCLAEFVSIPGRLVAQQPKTLSHLESAALPMSTLTALKSVRDVAKVRAGESVLINGASTGVGLYSVQLAVAAGATVTAVCSRRNAELVHSLGAKDVIAYDEASFLDTDRRYDVMIDIVSTEPVRRCRTVLTKNGRYLVVGAVSKDRWMGLGRQYAAALTSPFVSQSLRVVAAGRDRHDLDEIARHVDEGTLRPVIDREYAFDEACDAVRYVASGHTQGKVVVDLTT